LTWKSGLTSGFAKLIDRASMVSATPVVIQVYVVPVDGPTLDHLWMFVPTMA
jgi:hypothetical protein